MNNKLLFGLSLLLFGLFLALRLTGISELSIQPDEAHWRSRSLEVLNQARQHNWSKLTTHLGQPGVTPSLVMSFAEYIGCKLGFFHLQINGVRLDYLHFARIGCAIVSSLVVFPLIFLGKRFLPIPVVILACLLLSLSPNHSGLSKLAHLDAGMSFFVVTSLLFYIVARLENRFDFKIYSGIFWGFAIATKATAVVLPIAYLLWNLLIALILKKDFKKIFTVASFWAVFLGHLVLSVIYTRLWVHDSDYRIRLGIQSRLADLAYGFFTEWHFLWPLVLLLTCVQVLIKNGKIKNSWISFFLVFGLFCFLFPQIIENIIRFWTWVFSLKEEGHVSYGVQTNRLPFGYFGILLGDLSPTTLFGLFCGIILILYKLKRETSLNKKNIELYGLFGVIITFFVWTLLLSVSSKQTIRYLLPVLCPMFLVVSYFYYNLYLFILKKIEIKNARPLSFVLISILILPSILTFIRLNPYQMMYENKIINKLFRGDETIGHSYFIGLNEIVKYIDEYNTPHKKEVFVYGDLEALKVTRSIVSPTNENIKFMNPRKNTWGHLIVRFHKLDFGFRGLLNNQIDNIEPLFTSFFDGKKNISLYKMPIPDILVNEILSFTDFHRGNGVLFRRKAHKFLPNVKQCPNSLECLGVKRGITKKGFIAFGLNPHLVPGEYEFVFHVAGGAPVSNELKEKLAFKVKAGKCEKIIYGKEIEENVFREFKMNCKFDTLNPRQISMYWFGNQDLVVSELSITKKQNNLIQ